MITLKNVRWTNFINTGNYFTEINLQEAKTTLICGKNGSGKSTVMDAICFGLFGKPFRKANKPELINDVTNKNMLVEIEFSTESGHYFIRRGMKPTVFEIHANGLLIDQSADQRDYQKVLEQNVLKIDYKTFIQKVVVGSANFTPFMQLAAAARRQVIEDLLDIQVFSQMNILLKADAQLNKERIQEHDHQIGLLQRTISIHKENNKSLQKKSEEALKEQRARIREHVNALEVLKGKTEKLNSGLEKAYASRKKRDDLVEALVVPIKEEIFLKSKIERIEEKARFFHESDDCPTCRQKITEGHRSHVLASAEFDTSALKEQLEAFQKRSKELLEAKELYSKIDETIKALEKKKDEYANQELLHKSMIKNIHADMTKSKEVEYRSYKEEEEELEKLIKQKQFLLDQRELYNVGLSILKDNGIKANIIKQYIPIINKSINKYLEKMDFYCHFEVDENFNEKIRARYRSETSYDTFSEGEKMRIDLALLFTWREIAKMRNSSACNLLILDEIMDSSLDVEGTENFLNIIKKISDNNNIIVISHKSDQIASKFDRVIHFERVQSFGKVKETL